MKKPDELKEKKQLVLSVLSPIHIGAREGILRATDFMVVGKGVYIVDEDKLGAYLLAQGLLPRLVTAIQQGPVNLAVFLKDTGEPPEAIAPRIARLVLPGGDPTMTEFRPLLRDGQGQVYLPGSSLKGALRTAILYKMLQEPAWREKIHRQLQTELPCQGKGKEKRPKTVYYSDTLLNKQGLQNFALPPKGVTRDPTTDILRCLTIRDAYPVDPQKIRTGVIAIDFLSKKGEGDFYFSAKKTGAGPLRLWAEAILQGSFALELIWNKELFHQFRKNNSQSPPVQGLEDVLHAVQEMNRDVIAHEIAHYTVTPNVAPAGSLKEALKASTQQHTTPAAAACLKLKEFYEKRRDRYFRVGFGSGMLSTTLGLHLPPEIRQKIRDNCGSGPRPGDPAPKSRRIWQTSKGLAYPLGWLHLQEAPIPTE